MPIEKKSLSSKQTQIISALPEPLSSYPSTIEKKLRNLEKRKNRLETFKKSQEMGELKDPGQIEAVTQLPRVVVTIDVLNEYLKDVSKMLVDFGRKRATDELSEAKKVELAGKKLVRQLTIILDVLNSLGDEKVREDFAAGRSDACQLNDRDMASLDRLYKELTVTRVGASPEEYEKGLDLACDHVSKMHSRSKELFDGVTTYAALMSLIEKIQNSHYFTKDQNREDAYLTPEEYPDEIQPAPVIPTEPSMVPPPPMQPHHHVQPEPQFEDKLPSNDSRKRTESEVLAQVQSTGFVSFMQDDATAIPPFPQTNADPFISYPMAPQFHSGPAFDNFLGPPAVDSSVHLNEVITQNTEDNSAGEKASSQHEEHKKEESSGCFDKPIGNWADHSDNMHFNSEPTSYGMKDEGGFKEVTRIAGGFNNRNKSFNNRGGFNRDDKRGGFSNRGGRGMGNRGGGEFSQRNRGGGNTRGNGDFKGGNRGSSSRGFRGDNRGAPRSFKGNQTSKWNNSSNEGNSWPLSTGGDSDWQ